VQWEGVAHFEAALAAKKGVILITPHLGCWEVAAQAIAERFAPAYGAMSILFRPARKAAIAPLVARSRDKPGMKLFPTNSTGVRGLLRALRGGGIVGILPDQVPPQGQGVWAPFFGRPAYTMTLIARLAQQTGATVVMGWCERTPFAGRYTLHFERVEAPDLYDSGATPEQSATAMNAAIESLVRQAPSQYLWSYARYKQPRNEI
jgi:KDO2-lipid IV(A) lauroyltransferase